MTRGEIYARAKRAPDDLVRRGVSFFRSRGMGQVSSWLLMTWLIERACVDAAEREQWPA